MGYAEVFLRRVEVVAAVFALGPDSSDTLAHAHVLVYMLGIPALVPVLVAAYAVVGAREASQAG